MTLYLLAIGFISILGQVLILRELNVAFYGIELIYILAMGVWLFWTAIGALVGRRSYVPSATLVRYLFIIFALLLPADLAIIRGVRILFGGIPGSYLAFPLQLIAITITLLPVGILLGLLFQWAAKLYIESNKTLALAYAIESAGGLIGGLSSTLLLKYGVQNFAIAIICSLLAVGILLLPTKDRRDRTRYVGILLLFAMLLALWFSPRVDQRMTGWNHANLVDTRDSPYSRITIDGHKGQFIVFENDAFGFETESAAAEQLVHLAAINHDQLDRVLILGGGIEGLLAEILKHNPRNVDYVELNAVLLDLAEKHLPESYRIPLRSPTVEIQKADPRRYVKHAESYDLILVGMPEPTSGQSNRFYTRDFFEQCSKRLNPNGVLAFRLRSSENIWTQFVTYRNVSIYRALKSVFQDIVILPGVTNIVIASNNTLSRDPSLLADEFDSRQIETRLVTAAYIRYLYTNDRFFQIASQVDTTEVSPNTDVRPICYWFSSMIWLSKFIPKMINWDIASLKASYSKTYIWYAFALACLSGLFLLVRHKPRFQKPVLVAVAGFIGMILETILILHYQSKSGVLFQNIGILLMGFMAGLAVGSIVIIEIARSQTSKYGNIKRRLGRAQLIGFALLNLVFISLLYLNYDPGILVIAFLLFVSGFLVSGVFAFASLFEVEDQKILVSPLYAADLLGGCVGSLLGSLVLIPFFGMEQSAVMMTGLALAALLLV